MRILVITLLLALAAGLGLYANDLRTKNEDLTLSTAVLRVEQQDWRERDIQQRNEIDELGAMLNGQAKKILLLREVLNASLKKQQSAFRVRELELLDQIEALKREVDLLYCNQLPESFIENKARPTIVTQTFKRDGYEYRMVTYAVGTKSEGFDGLLFKDGEEILAGDLWGPRPRVDTPWGTMTWLGNSEQRKIPFQCCGWQVFPETDGVEVQ